MTIQEFKLLDLNQQAEAAVDHGEFVATRTMASYKITLWVIDDYYVILFYDYRESKLEKIRCFKNPDLLSAFLPQIDISAIFK